MNFKKIEGLQDVYPESIEGTSEWYCCKIAKHDFCDLYEAEEIMNVTGGYEGMNCVLIHFPDGKVYRPFEEKENQYVESPVYFEGKLYFLVVDFEIKQIQIISWNLEQKEVIVTMPLSEVKDCYNLRLVVSPLTLIRQGNDGYLEIVWPEKKKIEERSSESLILRDGNDFYFSRWYENPDYHEKVVIRDLETGYVKKSFDGQIQRMPNGDVWVL